ncbi:MAG: hypothetical protein OXD31_17145 [Chloroflexi bacterium]|nr:hypothetical protein [Chloroflexota bacterium]
MSTVRARAKAQAKQAMRALGDALVRTVPTTTFTLWLVAYAFDLSCGDMLRFVGNLQPIRPLLELVVGV